MNYAAQLNVLHEAMVRQQQQAMLALIKPVRGEALSPQTRLSVYVEGYSERLIDAVLADYPTLSHYMGAERSRAAVSNYVASTPSPFWDLNCYPVAFSEYMAAQNGDVAVQALAALESAIAEVFWLPESEALKPEMLSGISEEAFGQMHFSLRKASRLLRFDVAANAYLSDFRSGIHTTLKKEPERLLVIRLENEVQRVLLDEAEYQLLSALKRGLAFAEALAAMPDQEVLIQSLPGYINRWLQLGVFSKEYSG